MVRIILIIFIAFSGLLTSGLRAAEKRSHINEGSLHLAKSEILTEPVALDGKWKFTFLGQKSLIEVPGSWTRKGFPKFGEGLYELNIEFDDDVETLALRSDHFATEYRIVANGKLIEGPAQFTRDPEKAMAVHPAVIDIPVHGKKLELKIEVANYLDQIAGIVRPVLIGSSAAILNDLYVRKMLIIPVVSVFSLLLLYFLLVATRKDHRYLALILSGCCLCTNLFFAVQLVFFSGVVATWSTYIHLFDLGWIGAAYFFGLYNSSVFRWNLPRWYTHGFQQLPALIYLLTLAVPIPMRSQILIAMHLQILVSVIVNFSMTLGSVQKKADGAALFLVMSIVLLIAACNDILFAFGFIQSVYLFGFVFVVYLLAQGFFLARRHSALMVESANSHLLKSQIVLSQKISGNAEPFEVNHPAVQWASVFLPADDAGGDWVYLKQEGDYLYFFLADVTDHGFHSALMTLVLSSAVIAVLDEHSESEKDPLQILEKCAAVANHAVCRVGPSLNKFSTLSLHCLDLERGVITFIQAGHMPTLVSTEGKMKVLSNSHSLLGVDPRQVFKGKQYQLVRGDKIFAYTDGLTENVLDPVRGPLKQKQLTEILIHAQGPKEIQKELQPFIQGSHGQDTDDTAFIAVQWNQAEGVAKASV